jgi:hypothetical protein
VQINAKFRYVSDVRKLKTYGITSFEVGVVSCVCAGDHACVCVCVCVCVWAQVFQREEGKKKPVMKRLGVTRDAILILDGETRVRVERRVVRS